MTKQGNSFFWSGLVLSATLAMAPPVAALSEPCQLVARMAGKSYEPQPLRLASLTAQADMPAELELRFVAQNGGWFIYETAAPWMDKEQCAPLVKLHSNGSVEFAPVLRNSATGQDAVVTASFMIQTYRAEDIDRIAKRYGFRFLTRLPKAGSAIFDVRGVASYDRMLEELDRDKDIQFAVPVLSEPRYRLR